MKNGHMNKGEMAWYIFPITWSIWDKFLNWLVVEPTQLKNIIQIG